MSEVARHRIVVVGDDFTPAELLREAIEEHPRFVASQAAFELADIAEGEFHQGERDEVSEFLGDPAQITELVRSATIIVTTFAPITGQLLAAAPNLELVACGRGGPVNVDIDAATRLGVAVTSCPGRNAEAVAEFVLGAIIAATRRLPAAERYLRGGEWLDGREDSFAKPTGPELEGRTLGVVGFGAIGKRVSELVAPLRMRLLVFDPFADEAAIVASGAEATDLEDLLARADVVTVHARPSGGGRPLLGRAEIDRMRPDAFLINTSRGENLDEDALVAALEGGRLAGAALDVFAVEPLPQDHPLRRLDNVLLTPHSAGVSRDVPRRTAQMLADSVTAWLHGEHPTHVCNPAARIGLGDEVRGK